MRRRLTTYYSRRAEAERAAQAVRPLAAGVEIVDAGIADDLEMFSRIGLGVVAGGAAGVVVGVIAGAVLKVWTGPEWAIVLAICAIAMGAFGSLLGGMCGSAMGGVRDAEGDAVALVAHLPAGNMRAAQERLARAGGTRLA